MAAVVHHGVNFRSASDTPVFDDALPIVKEVLTPVIEATGFDAFLLHNVLSPKECEYYIQQSEDEGYRSLAGEYAPSYRNNDRAIITSLPLAELLWERCRAHVVPTYEDDGSLWDAVGLNECMRFCRYDNGGHFKPHSDSGFYRDSTECSFYTFNLYLNTVPEESLGATNFLAGRYRTLAERRLLASVRPTAGTVLVFEHAALHEGDSVLCRKYLMRSDVMYHRRS